MRTSSWIIAVSIALLAACRSACWCAEFNVGAYYYPWYGDNYFHSSPNLYSSIRWYLLPQEAPYLGW